MNINYTESFNFKPIPAITPLDGYWQNGTWKFNMSEITTGASSQPSWQDIVLSGNGSLTLTNAKADGLNYLKLFGGAEQRNLPEGYTEYDGLIGDGAAYIDLNCTLDQDDEIEFEFTMPSTGITSKNIFGYRDSANSQAITAMIASSGSNTFISDFNNSNYTDYRLSFALSSSTRYRVVINKNGRYIYDSTGTLVASNTTACSDTITTGNVLLFGIGGSPAYTGSGSKFNGTIHRCLIKGKRDVVPCGNGTAYGMYDKLNGVFYPNANTEGSFTVGNATVPSPDTPMDIVCNNGTIKARMASGLPLGYTRVSYLQSSGTQAINTGVKYDGNNFVVKWRAIDSSTSQGTLFACTGAQPYSGGLFGTKVNRKYYLGYGSGLEVGYTTNNDFHEWEVTVSGQNVTLKKDGVQIGTETLTGTIDTEHNIYLFCGGWINSTNQTLTQFSLWDLDYWQLWKNGTLAFDGIACKDSNNTLGIYDKVSGELKTNVGTGAFAAGSAVTDNIVIYTDGTTETVQVIGKNLYNVATRITGYYISAEGVPTENSDSCYSALIPVQPNTYYTYSGRAYGGNKRLHAYDASGNWIQQINYASVSASTQQVAFDVSGQTPANCKYVRISGASADTNVQLEQGSTATTYEPYYNGGSATAEDLLKVGTYQDVQSVLDGQVTRNVGIKVLDGTEGWTQSAATNNLFYTTINNSSTDNTYIPVSSHFQGVVASTGYATMTNGQFKHGSGTNSWYFKNTDCANATAFSQWLADQYNAGNPVIIVYPLATATTEVVTAQALTTQAGTNIVEITQASINNLPLEVSYKGVI